MPYPALLAKKDYLPFLLRYITWLGLSLFTNKAPGHFLFFVFSLGFIFIWKICNGCDLYPAFYLFPHVALEIQ